MAMCAELAGEKRVSECDSTTDKAVRDSLLGRFAFLFMSVLEAAPEGTSRQQAGSILDAIQRRLYVRDFRTHQCLVSLQSQGRY